jgi:hypothetical protein
MFRRTGARGISIRASNAWALDDLYQGWLGDQKSLPVATDSEQLYIPTPIARAGRS